MFGGKSKSEELLEQLALQGGNEAVLFNIEEIKSMRNEINWRVKVAYNSSVAFISLFAFVVGQLFSTDNKLIDSITQDPQLLVKSGMAILVLISAWVGVQNANHLIEKRIELYSLELMRTIYSNSNQVFFSWLGYLYGSVFFRGKIKNFISKFFNASVGLFIYFLPNFIAFGIWIYLLTVPEVKDYIFFFSIVSFFLFIAIGTTFFFFFYVVKVNNNHTIFYKEVMMPYFEKQKLDINSSTNN